MNKIQSENNPLPLMPPKRRHVGSGNDGQVKQKK